MGLSHCAYHLQAQVYREDFALERHDREVAHGKLTDLKRKYTSEVEELKAQLAQIEQHHKERLAEVEHVHQGREKEVKTVLEEASKKKNQQELQAKTSQVKQYKKRVDSLKNQVCFLGTFITLNAWLDFAPHCIFALSFSFLNWKVATKNC